MLTLLGMAGFVLAAFLIGMALCFVRLADDLSRHYRGRPVRWSDFWREIDE